MLVHQIEVEGKPEKGERLKNTTHLFDLGGDVVHMVVDLGTSEEEWFHLDRDRALEEIALYRKDLRDSGYTFTVPVSRLHEWMQQHGMSGRAR